MENEAIKICEEYKENNNLNDFELMAVDLIIILLKMEDELKKQVDFKYNEKENKLC